jgi:hypothetical protein
VRVSRARGVSASIEGGVIPGRKDIDERTVFEWGLAWLYDRKSLNSIAKRYAVSRTLVASRLDAFWKTKDGRAVLTKYAEESGIDVADPEQWPPMDGENGDDPAGQTHEGTLSDGHSEGPRTNGRRHAPNVALFQHYESPPPGSQSE